MMPDGKRAFFDARGDIFSVPAKEGVTFNFTSTSSIHERNIACSPDGKYIAYISDKNGEDEIYIQAADGSGTTEQLTSLGDTYKYSMLWSPDSKKILWSDKLQRLQYIDVNTKRLLY